MKTLKMLKPAVGKVGCLSGAMHSDSMGREKFLSGHVVAKLASRGCVRLREVLPRSQ